MQVWGIGEVLWDIFPDRELFGGAALNFCASLQRLGDTATLLSAVGQDARGELALRRMAELQLGIRYIREVGDLPTGVAVVSKSSDGEPNYVIPRPVAFDRVIIDDEAIREAQQQGVDWIYYGTLLQVAGEVERSTTELIHQLPKARRFYDMNLRTGQWNLPLIQRLSGLATVLKLNEMEAQTLSKLTQTGNRDYSLEDFTRIWAETYGIDVICVTLGPSGCSIYANRVLHDVPGYSVTVSDTVGSGDAFAAAFLHGYHQHWPIQRIGQFANAVGALVASRAGATPEWTTAEALAMVAFAGEKPE